jgi:DinB superfamily
MERHLARLHREIEAAVAELSAEQLAWHPDGKWCAAEILEHLYLTYTGTTKGFGRVLEAGKSLARRATWKDHSRTLVVVGFGYMPRGRQAPPLARPRGLPAEKVLAEIGVKLTEMNDVMEQCALKLGAKAKVLDHPVLGPFSVSQWRKFHLVHGLHHVKQIRRLRENLTEMKSAGA